MNENKYVQKNQLPQPTAGMPHVPSPAAQAGASGNDQCPLWLSVDVGGTTMKLALFAGRDIPSLTLLQRLTIPTRTMEEGRFILPDLADAIQRLVTEAGYTLPQIAGLGIGLPGPVLPRTEKGYPVNGCVNLNWRGLSYPDVTLRELTGIREIYVCNDANAAALGELYFGEAVDETTPARDAVMVTIGTGIGGGVVLAGQVLAGAFGAGGEVGHMPMHPSGELLQEVRQADPTLLLAHADLEYYTAAPGIVRVAQAALQAGLDGVNCAPQTDKSKANAVASPNGDFKGRPTMYNKSADAHPVSSGAAASPSTSEQTPSTLRQIDTLQARDVFDAAKTGDAMALQITDFFFDTLGQGLACIASTVDPDLFIIGGGVAAAGDFLLSGLQEAYRRHVFAPSRETSFRLATLGNDAGLLGPLVPFLTSGK